MNTILSPHKAFLYLSLGFGLLMLVCTPPFQPQDERAHFYRAWQVYTGTFSSIKQDQRLGGYIPKSIDKFYVDFHPFFLNSYNRISLKQLWQTRLIELNPNDTVFIDFTNTALYSSFLYLPQAFGLFIGKQLGVAPFWLIYIGRLFNLLIFIISVYYAIKIMPFKKWLFVLLATLPMSLVVNSSMSADVLVNSLAYLIIAIILNFSFNDKIQKITYNHLLLIVIFALLIGMAKLVYVPILFLLVFIPSGKFSNAKIKIGFLAVVIFTGFGTAFIQKTIIDSKYIPYSEYNVKYRDYTSLNKGCDINKQVDFIKENPIRTMKVFIKSFFNEFKNMTHGYVGLLGWGHDYPPAWFVYLAYLFIFMCMLFGLNNSISDFSFLQRCIFVSIALGILFIIMLSQYLSWDLVGENKAYPLIGRYFIPVFPLFFLFFYNLFKIKMRASVNNALINVVFVFCLLSGVLSIYLTLKKSYTLNDYSNAKWQVNYSFKNNCNDTNNVEYVIFNHDTIAEFSKPEDRFISNEKFFTGTRSLKMSRNNPYGFTVRIYNACANDKLIVSCRIYGYGGLLDIQESPQGFNLGSGKYYSQKDSLGWKYKEEEFIIPHNIPNGKVLGIFVWYPYADSIYVDNFKLLYFEKNNP